MGFAVQDAMALLNGRLPNGLGQVALAGPAGAKEESVVALPLAGVPGVLLEILEIGLAAYGVALSKTTEPFGAVIFVPLLIRATNYPQQY